MIKIRYGQATIIADNGKGIRLIKFNKRFYTTFGRLFAVKGNHVDTPYDQCAAMPYYAFCDWDNLCDMYFAD